MPVPATRPTQRRWRTSLAALAAIGMSPGGASPFNHEWQVIVLSADYAGAFLARDLGDRGLDADRRYEFIYTHDRDTVVTAAKAFLAELPTAA